MEEEETCPICLDGITPEQLYITSCAHKFHNKCFCVFIKKSPTLHCPICRTEIQKKETPDNNTNYFFNLRRFDEHVRRMQNEAVNAQRREDGRRYLHSFVNALQNVNIENITETLRRNDQIEATTEDVLNTFGPTILHAIGTMFMERL